MCQSLLQALLHFKSLNSHRTLEGQCYCYTHLTEEETEAHIGHWFKPVHPDSKALGPDCSFAASLCCAVQPHSFHIEASVP